MNQAPPIQGNPAGAPAIKLEKTNLPGAFTLTGNASGFRRLAELLGEAASMPEGEAGGKMGSRLADQLLRVVVPTSEGSLVDLWRDEALNHNPRPEAARRLWADRVWLLGWAATAFLVASLLALALIGIRSLVK